MCEYIKSRFPHVYLYTSTNGLAFNEEQARRLAHSGIDEVTFSIDGATPESYAKYHQRGKFDVAIRNLRAMADEKRRAGPRRGTTATSGTQSGARRPARVSTSGRRGQVRRSWRGPASRSTSARAS